MEPLHSDDELAKFEKEINKLFLWGKLFGGGKYKPADKSFLFRWAINYKQYKIARKLVELGADINNPGENDYTPLIQTCLHGNYDFARYLIDNGADIYHITPSGCSVLTCVGERIKTDLDKAKELQHFQILIVDLVKKIDMRMAHPQTGNTIFHYMANDSHLLWLPQNNRACINEVNAEGETPLDLFLKRTISGKKIGLGLFIAYGAKYNKIDDNEETRDVIRLMNKDTLFHVLVVKLRASSRCLLCKLPAELIQLLHFMLCGNKAVDREMLQKYLSAKTEINE